MSPNDDGMFILEQREELDNGVWEKFTVRDRERKPRHFWIKVRPAYRHKAQEIRQRFEEEVRDPGSGRRIRAIPEEKEDAFTAAMADYLIADWGAPDDPEHPHGPASKFNEDGNLVNLPAANRFGMRSVPESRAQEVEIRPWPAKRGYKALLLHLLPALDQQVADFANQLSASIEGTPEEREEEERNLESAQPGKREARTSTASGGR